MRIRCQEEVSIFKQYRGAGIEAAFFRARHRMAANKDRAAASEDLYRCIVYGAFHAAHIHNHGAGANQRQRAGHSFPQLP